MKLGYSMHVHQASVRVITEWGIDNDKLAQTIVRGLHAVDPESAVIVEVKNGDGTVVAYRQKGDK